MGSIYRITHQGRAAAAAGPVPLGSRYLHDLLDLLETCGGGVPDSELRQFMPPASLEASILTLLELGLIECGESAAPRRRTAPLPYPRAFNASRV